MLMKKGAWRWQWKSAPNLIRCIFHEFVNFVTKEQMFSQHTEKPYAWTAKVRENGVGHPICYRSQERAVTLWTNDLRSFNRHSEEIQEFVPLPINNLNAFILVFEWRKWMK